MKQDTINYFSVGLFVIGALLVLIIGLYLITGRGSSADDYYVELKNVSGIRAGSPVTYAGFQIGQLLDIDPVRANGATRYRLLLQVRSGWKIPEDSVAQIVSPGLLAEKQIDITEGQSASFLNVGSVIKSQEATDMFSVVREISTEFQKLSDEGLKPLLRSLNTDVAGAFPDLLRQVSRLLQNLNQSATRLQALLDSVDEQRIGRIVNNAEQMTQNLIQVSNKLDTAAQQVDSLVTTTSTMMEGNNDDLRKALLDLRTTMGVIEQNMNSIMYNIDSTSRNLNEFSRQIRDNPSVLLNSSTPKDAVQP